MSLSSSLEKEIDEYTKGSDESSEGSAAGSDSLDKHYSSGVPGIPLEEFRELQHRMASKSRASSSRKPPSPP